LSRSSSCWMNVRIVSMEGFSRCVKISLVRLSWVPNHLGWVWQMNAIYLWTMGLACCPVRVECNHVVMEE
jgi:hypothetical protein